jgi:E3 ubiquitin-protein ligase Arkadia
VDRGWEIDDFSYENLLRLDSGNLKQGLCEEELDALACTAAVAKPTPDECCICLADIEEGDPSTVLACEHVFHTPCIKTWLKEKNKCPLCRMTLQIPNRRFAASRAAARQRRDQGIRFG